MKTKLTLLICLLPFLLFCGGKVKGDKEILDQINKVVANCEVDTRYTFLKNCKENADKDLEKLLKAKGVPASLPSLAIALNDDDIKVSATSASMLYTHYKGGLKEVSENPKLIDKNVVQLFQKALEKHKSQYYTFYAVRTVVLLSVINNNYKKLVEFLKTHPEKAVQNEGLSYLMQYGRLTTFSIVKDLAKQPELTVMAIQNPRNMYKYTDPETKEICTWLTGFLDDSDLKISQAAAVATATRCKGEYLDKLLDKLEKVASEGKLQGGYRSSLTNFSFSCQSFLGSPATGSEAQCERKKKLLEEPAADKP